MHISPDAQQRHTKRSARSPPEGPWSPLGSSSADLGHNAGTSESRMQPSSLQMGDDELPDAQQATCSPSNSQPLMPLIAVSHSHGPAQLSGSGAGAEPPEVPAQQTCAMPAGHLAAVGSPLIERLLPEPYPAAPSCLPHCGDLPAPPMGAPWLSTSPQQISPPAATTAAQPRDDGQPSMPALPDRQSAHQSPADRGQTSSDMPMASILPASVCRPPDILRRSELAAAVAAVSADATQASPVSGPPPAEPPPDVSQAMPAGHQPMQADDNLTEPSHTRLSTAGQAQQRPAVKTPSGGQQVKAHVQQVRPSASSHHDAHSVQSRGRPSCRVASA